MGERRVTLSPGVERLVRAAAEPPRCATCKHWNADAQSNPDFGRCERIEEDTLDDPAHLDGGYDGMFTPELITRPTFGCTLWAGRAAEEGTDG